MNPGRPSSYSPELGAQICERIAAGESLRSICRDEGMPVEGTVRKWAIENREGFFTQYSQARDIGLDAMADETLEISDDGSNDWIEREHEGGRIETLPDHEHINRSRLRVDTRKWYLSKLAPKRYGEMRPEVAVASSNFQVLVLSAGMAIPAVVSPNVGLVIEAEPA